MCGNFGALLFPCSTCGAAGPDGLQQQGIKLRPFDEICRDMVEKTRIRGSQAAGLSIISCPLGEDKHPSLTAGEMTTLRARVIPGKRKSISEVLLNKYHSLMPAAAQVRLMDGAVTCIGHSRFATSSQ